MNASVKHLLQFINEQPVDRPVDQSLWNTCAVNDYAEECLLPEDDFTLILNDLCESEGYSYCDIDGYVSDNSKLMPMLNVISEDVDTYGKLQEYIKSNLVTQS